ncbi:hypothetical protein Leryth_007868, partial [Lithospermum erythrorhizon]
MLSNETPSPDPSLCPCEISQLNNNNNSSSDDQQPCCVLQSDLLISCPNFTIRDYAFSNRSKDIKTSWPFSGKSLQLCLNHGVKDLLPPFQSLGAVKKPATAQRSTIATSLFSKENQYHIIDQASRPTNHLLSVTSVDAQPSLTSVHTNPSRSEGVRIFPSMVVEADTLLNTSASKPVKKISLVNKKVEKIMKPLTKKCREILKLNNTAADHNKLDYNTSNNFFVSETMASKVCPVCKTFTSSSNTTLNAHIDQCLSGESVSQWTSDPKVIKSRIKPKRMRSMVDIYVTAQHCTIEELERRNGINFSTCSGLPAQDMEVGSVERKRKSPVDLEEIENEAAVYLKGTKLRILSKLNDLSSPVMAGDDTGTCKHVDGEKSRKLCLAKMKKKKLQEKHHKLHIRVSDSKKFCSPRHHQNSQINSIQEHSRGPEEHLEVEEAFTKPPRAHGLIKDIEQEFVGRRIFSKRSVPTKMNNNGDHPHPTCTREKKLAGVNSEESPRYSYLNGGCGSKSNKSSGTSPASPRSSEPHNGYGRVLSLRRSVRAPLGFEPCYDKNNPPMEGNKKESNKSDSSVKCKSKDEVRNKLNPVASLSIRKVKLKRALTRNGSSVCDNSKDFPDGLDTSSKSRGFPSLTQKQASRLSNPQESAPESDRVDIARQTIAKISKDVTTDRREPKVRRDRGNVKASGEGKTLVLKGMKSTSDHSKPQVDGINYSYSDNVTAGSGDEKESEQNNVQPCEKDVVDEVTCNSPFFEASKGHCKPSDVQCHEVTGHLDVQSDSRGYMIFCDEQMGTEDARFPVESILNGVEKMFYINEEGKSIFGQNVHATTKLHSNDGSGCYYAEVDLIPIPGPPGSFLPSPSSNGFHGNSTPASSHNRSSENHHEFADGDSSPSPTSTISNSDIAKFDSSLIERFPFQHSIQDVKRLSVYDATAGTMVDKISLDSSKAFAGGGGLDTVEPEVHLVYTKSETPLGIKNDNPCRCSQKDGAVLSSADLNYRDTSLLSWPSMPLVPESPFNTQVNPDETRLAKTNQF